MIEPSAGQPVPAIFSQIPLRPHNMAQNLTKREVLDHAMQPCTGFFSGRPVPLRVHWLVCPSRSRPADHPLADQGRARVRQVHSDAPPAGAGCFPMPSGRQLDRAHPLFQRPGQPGRRTVQRCGRSGAGCHRPAHPGLQVSRCRRATDPAV